MDKALLEIPCQQPYLPMWGLQTVFVQVTPDAITNKFKMAEA